MKKYGHGLVRSDAPSLGMRSQLQGHVGRWIFSSPVGLESAPRYLTITVNVKSSALFRIPNLTFCSAKLVQRLPQAISKLIFFAGVAIVKLVLNLTSNLK